MPDQEEDPRVLEKEVHQERVPEDGCHWKPQASVRSSCYKRNPITSSYSSTRGFPPVETRRQPSTRHAKLSQRLTKTVSQQGPQAPSSSCPLSQRKSQPDSGPGDTLSQRPPSRNRSPSCDRPRKRKFPLLPRRRGAPLRLPPPPELGYRVTPEHIDAEKKALWQRISRALWGDPEATSGCSAPQPLRSSPKPASRIAPMDTPSTPSSTSLRVTSARSAGPSACTSTGMAPKTASDTDVTPMDTTPVDTTTMDTTPMDTTPPTYAVFSGAPLASRGGKQAAAAPVQAPTSTPGQPALGSTTHATLGTQASTQANTGPATAALGPSGTATQPLGGSVSRHSRKRSSARTLIGTTGPNPQNNPVLGGTTAPMLTPILGGAPTHSAHPSSGGLSTTSKAASSGVSLPVSTPSHPAIAMGTSRASGTTSQPITWAVSAGPSTSKSSGSAPNPTSNTDVTPMDTTPPK
ncbi:hypothetical protein HJG60_011291 [Phyllostomus discolor]|uniref:POM121-like protein 1 n=1 Tax=Phyllostomus discolor TaxID=89673 RepID=A0A834A2H2_9CHIR|nr:hypothetical protein HJG60_011291 [Phyllostomus discolor]